jgi:hypothetical protein
MFNFCLNLSQLIQPPHKAHIILDADENWILVEITTPRKTVQKLFRLDSIDGLTLVK